MALKLTVNRTDMKNTKVVINKNLSLLPYFIYEFNTVFTLSLIPLTLWSLISKLIELFKT